MTYYQYTPLDDPNAEIRLLELLPGDRSIRCRLKVVRLDNNVTPYEPLSYSWGDKPNLKRITVDDVSFKIKDNLHAALKRLRYKSQVRTLWVDAICINQADKYGKEKSAQLGLMRRIYEGGQRTLVWLGEHSNRTAHAFFILEFLSGYIERHPGVVVSPFHWHKLHRTDRGKTAIPTSPLGRIWGKWKYDRAITALYSVVGQLWFKRVWVIQEIAMSKEALVVCGVYTIDWNKIEKVCLGSEYGLDVSGSRYAEMLCHQRNNCQQGKSANPGITFLEAAASQATEPKDRIYALLGLIDDTLSVEIDYSIDLQILFRETTEKLLRETKNAVLLSACVGCDQPDVPSWVIRFEDVKGSVTHFNHFARQTPGDRQPHRRASGNSSFTPGFGDNGTILQVGGHRVDRVASIGSVRESVTHVDKSLKGLQDFICCYLEWRLLGGLGPNSDCSRWGPSHDAFLHTLCPWSEGQDANFEKLKEEFKKFDHMVVSNCSFLFRYQAPNSSTTWNGIPPPSSHGTMIDDMRSLLLTAVYVLRYNFGYTPIVAAVQFGSKMYETINRRMVKTERGYIGLVPRETRLGDEVVLIAGAVAPFILRPMGSNRYRIVGDCYICGIMYGEAWDAEKSSSI